MQTGYTSTKKDRTVKEFIEEYFRETGVADKFTRGVLYYWEYSFVLSEFSSKLESLIDSEIMEKMTRIRAEAMLLKLEMLRLEGEAINEVK